MTHFTLSEIFSSILSALIFGALLAIALIAASVIYRQLFKLKLLPKAIFLYDGSLMSAKSAITYTEKAKVKKYTKALHEFYAFFRVVLFSSLFLLLSYYALDGAFRIYMLIVSLGALFSVKYLLTHTFVPIAEKVFETVFYGIIILFRILTFPMKRILFLKWNKIYEKKHKKT